MEKSKIEWVKNKLSIFTKNDEAISIFKNSEDVWLVKCDSKKCTYEFIVYFKPNVNLDELVNTYIYAYKKSKEECLNLVLDDTTEIIVVP